MLVSKKQEWVVYEEPAAPITSAKPKQQPNKGLRIKCFVVAVTMALMAMLVTVQSEYVVSSGYDLVQMKAQAAKLEKENELLKLEIAKLKSPQRIEYIATTQLGMVLPQAVMRATPVNGKNETAGNAQEQVAVGSVLNMFKAGKAEASKGR